MQPENLKSVTRRALYDGFVSSDEAKNIQKQALKEDNTVTEAEKVFLQDAYESGAYFEPKATEVIEKLLSYGETSIKQEMTDLRKQKVDQRWFNSEYLVHALPLIQNSTDSLNDRISELKKVKSETGMFTSDYRPEAEKILVNSFDSIAVKMSELKTLKRDANMFTSEFKDLGKKLLLESLDQKTARLMALDQFKSDANLWTSEYNELKDLIINN